MKDWPLGSGYSRTVYREGEHTVRKVATGDHGPQENFREILNWLEQGHRDEEIFPEIRDVKDNGKTLIYPEYNVIYPNEASRRLGEHHDLSVESELPHRNVEAPGWEVNDPELGYPAEKDLSEVTGEDIKIIDHGVVEPMDSYSPPVLELKETINRERSLGL